MSSHRLDKSIEAELRAISGNNICCDCDDKNPQWASVSLGVFMCLECSGRHRALGVHISFVRSVSMDSWNDKQIKQMRTGGNDKCNAFLKQYGVPKDMPIQQKYNTPAALLYRDRLLAEVEGRPLPTELPKIETRPSNASMGSDRSGGMGMSSSGSSRMKGIGSDASYRPGGNGPAGINTAEVSAHLQDVSHKALSFLSSTVAVLGDKVKTTAAAAADAYSHAQHHNNNGNGNSMGSDQHHSTSNDRGPSNNSSSSSGGIWSAALASSASNLWHKAAAATSDIVKDLTRPPDEDEFKFPRPGGYSDGSSGAAQVDKSRISGVGVTDDLDMNKASLSQPPSMQRNTSTSSTTSTASQGRGKSKVEMSDDWDELDIGDDEDVPDDVRRSRNKALASKNKSGFSGNNSDNDAFPPRPPVASSSDRSLNSRGSGSGNGSGSNLNKVDSPSPKRNTSGLSLASAGSGNSANTGASAASAKPTTVSRSTSAGSTTAKPAAAAAPTGDDFFANFGV